MFTTGRSKGYIDVVQCSATGSRTCSTRINFSHYIGGYDPGQCVRRLLMLLVFDCFLQLLNLTYLSGIETETHQWSSTIYISSLD